jgi:hypothetical protein
MEKIKRYIDFRSPEILQLFVEIQEICEKYFPREAMFAGKDEFLKAVKNNLKGVGRSKHETPLSTASTKLCYELARYFRLHTDLGPKIVKYLDTEAGRQELLKYHWDDNYLDDTYLLAVQKIMNDEFEAHKTSTTIDFMSTLEYLGFVVSSMVTQNNIALEEGKKPIYANFDGFLEKTNWDIFIQFAYSYFKNVKDGFGVNTYNPNYIIDFFYPVKMRYRTNGGRVDTIPLVDYFTEDTIVQNKLILSVMQSQINHIIAYQVAEKAVVQNSEDYYKFYAGERLYRKIPNFLVLTGYDDNIEDKIICNVYSVLNAGFIESMFSELSDYKKIIKSITPAFSYNLTPDFEYNKDLNVSVPEEAYLLKSDVMTFIENKELITKYISSYVHMYLGLLNTSEENSIELLNYLAKQKGEVLFLYKDYSPSKGRNGIFKLFVDKGKEAIKNEINLTIKSLDLNKTINNPKM